MERKEISELESHNTWNIIDRKSLTEGEHILLSTWAFKIPEGANILPSTWAYTIPEGDRSFYGLVQSPLYWFNMSKNTLMDNSISKLEQD